MVIEMYMVFRNLQQYKPLFAMENIYTFIDYNENEIDINLRNIIAMNQPELDDDTSEDFDLDFDLNNFFYEMRG